jgi:hypothetical protein
MRKPLPHWHSSPKLTPRSAASWRKSSLTELHASRRRRGERPHSDPGLGICTVTSWSDGAVRELFDLPESFRPDVTVAVGHPVATPRMPTTKGKQFLPNIHYNTFNTPYDEVKR